MADENPYTSPLAESSHHLQSGGGKSMRSVWRCIWSTTIIGTVSSFPLAGLIGLLFRFPVPFAGYMSGPTAFLPAMVGAFIYAILGGVLVQVVMGVVGGLIAYQVTRHNSERLRSVVLICGMASALPGLLLLSMLDWIIGPW